MSHTTKTRVVELTERAEAKPPAPIEESPLYGVAMLKIAMELKKPGAPELDEILTGVLGRLRLDESDFRRFLAQNGGLLRSIAERKRY